MTIREQIFKILCEVEALAIKISNESGISRVDTGEYVDRILRIVNGEKEKHPIEPLIISIHDQLSDAGMARKINEIIKYLNQ